MIIFFLREVLHLRRLMDERGKPKSKGLSVDLATLSLMNWEKKKRFLFFWIDTEYDYLLYNLCLLIVAEIYGFSKKMF